MSEEMLHHPYVEDDPATVYRELKDGEALIYRAAQGLFTFEEERVRKHEAYENKKNDLLKRMYDEETSATGVKKRTEEHRKALYRLTFHEERLLWQLAEADTKAQKGYLDALIAIQTSIEARAKLISLDERFAGRNYGP